MAQRQVQKKKAKMTNGHGKPALAANDCEMCHERQAVTTGLCMRCYHWTRYHTRLEVVNPGHLKIYIKATDLRTVRYSAYVSGELNINMAYDGHDVTAAVRKIAV